MLSEFLRRFREAGVPGAPAAAGAPANHVATLEEELAPVFALLEEVEDQADALEADGRRRAERRRIEASDQARAIVEDSRARAAGEQASTAAARFARADEKCAAVRLLAAEESARIDRAARERIPPLVAELVERILGGPGSAAQP